MTSQSQRSDATAVSPVVAVILLVAITVALSAVVGAFALDLGQQSTSGTSTGSAGVKASLGTDASNTHYVELSVVSTSDTLYYTVNGTTNLLGTTGDTVRLYDGQDYQSGDDITITTASGDTVVQTVSTQSTASDSTLDEGLVSHWSFDHASGASTAVDDAGTSNGTIYGADYTTAAKFGTHALEFNGTEYVEVPHKDAYNTSHITLTAWVKPNTTEQSEERIVNRFSPNGEVWEFSVRTRNDSELRYVLRNESNFGVGDHNGSVPLTEWTFVAITYDGETVTQYVNGDPIYRNHTMSGPLMNSDSNIGLGTPAWNMGHGTYSFNGTIDDIRVYNRSLSDGEIDSLYRQTR